MVLPRMRTAAGVLSIIREADPDTEVTMHYIRRIIATNQVPVASVGIKKLVDADTVIAYIAAGTPSMAREPERMGEIRRVVT